MRYLILAALLLSTPLSAQQTVVVPDVNIEVQVDPTPIEVSIQVMSDSTMLVNLNENLRLLREQIAAQECNTCEGTTTVVRVGQFGLTALALWMAISLHKLAGKESTHTTDIDVNTPDVDVQVDVDVHEHKDDEHYGESK